MTDNKRALELAKKRQEKGLPLNARMRKALAKNKAFNALYDWKEEDDPYFQSSSSSKEEEMKEWFTALQCGEVENEYLHHIIKMEEFRQDICTK